MNRPIATLSIATAILASGHAQAAYGPQLEGFDYPYPLQTYSFSSQQQALEMGYLDVPPSEAANGKTAVLLHGKNFCGATWETTIKVLSNAGYRVIAPDQVGFCSSSKPRGYQFSFGQLADNTDALLASLNIDKATIIGHSMGGMIVQEMTKIVGDRINKLITDRKSFFKSL